MSIFSQGTRQYSIKYSLNAGVTTTMRSDRPYKNFAMDAKVRCSKESLSPMPTAARDSGHRSRTSKTNGIRRVKLSHQPESPTRSWGEEAMITSVRGRVSPRKAAERQKDA